METSVLQTFSERSLITEHLRQVPSTMNGTVPNGILANQFWGEANAFADAARALISADNSFYAPTYFLLCHALELALKSYLLANDVPLAEVIKLGHDLTRAYAKAHQLGMRVPGEHVDVLIDRLSEFHQRMIFRYPVITKDEGRLILRGHLIRPEEIQELVVSICRIVRTSVFAARLHAAKFGNFPIETWHMGLPEGGPEEGD
ncbi:HEPN domain-containing protein [Bradyrhizobium ottawaense]|uniref:HEPN domain-containing protein n=1 Tax=Bradyrhizobium ottawaense TaxID=931866 RepID=UPI0020124908|nr:HEPN domain-containing protein [Bradyrhizobium ottawaense]